jgi:hypothetical protein
MAAAAALLVPVAPAAAAVFRLVREIRPLAKAAQRTTIQVRSPAPVTAAAVAAARPLAAVVVPAV